MLHFIDRKSHELCELFPHNFPNILMRFHNNNALFLSVAFHDYWSQQWQLTDVKFSVLPTQQNDNGAHFKSCALVGTPHMYITSSTCKPPNAMPIYCDFLTWRPGPHWHINSFYSVQVRCLASKSECYNIQVQRPRSLHVETVIHTLSLDTEIRKKAS